MRHLQEYKVGDRVKAVMEGTVAQCCWDFNAGDWLYDVHWDNGVRTDIYQEFLVP